MQVQTVFVTTALSIQEKLAEFTGPETGPNHAVIQHELVNWKDRDCRLPRVIKREVGWVTGASPSGVVDIVSVYHDFLQISVLAEVFNGLKFSFICYFWC